MTDHPTTFQGESAEAGVVAWDDHATIHQNHDGQGVLDGLKALHRGTLAEMVARIMSMPEDDRSGYVIQKGGDHKYGPAEIAALAKRPDYPGKRS